MPVNGSLEADAIKIFGPPPPQKPDVKVPMLLPTVFPEIAWRGLFADYRDLMAPTTEASDVAHFTTFWAIAASILGRKVKTFQGEVLYPNVYLSVFGRSGDKKTTAQNRLHLLKHPSVKVITAVGSTEGLAAELADVSKPIPTEDAPEAMEVEERRDTPILFYWEELSEMMSRGRWSGATLFEFLTKLYGCPPDYELKYVKRPVLVPMPTTSVLCATTVEWFWKSAQPQDFFGGFGNRILFLTGEKKPPKACPPAPDRKKLKALKTKLHRLADLEPCKAQLSKEARDLWHSFYNGWETTRRPELLAAASKRVPSYILKLAMVYAALERQNRAEQRPQAPKTDNVTPLVTGPSVRKQPMLSVIPLSRGVGGPLVIQSEQLKAAIEVGRYATQCVETLLEERLAKLSPWMEQEQLLERKILKYVKEHPDTPKRPMQQRLSKYCTAKQFNAVIASMVEAGRLNQNEETLKLSLGKR